MAVDKSVVVFFSSEYNKTMKNSFLKIVFALVFFLLPFWSSVVFAGTEHNMSGWAWSSNIGWISFNNTNTGGSVDYGVYKNSDGTLTGRNADDTYNAVGYAWSSNIGWIQFGGLSGFPSGAGTTASNAQVVGTELRGWAKALSADDNGWDGWIALSGTSYGVTLTDTGSSQYDCTIDCVWGSNVVGWVDFSGVIVGTPAVLVATLNVNSSGATSVLITGTMGDTTNYTKNDISNISTTLTAPATSGGANFSGWTSGVCTELSSPTQFNCTISVTVGDTKTVTANFIGGAGNGQCSNPQTHYNCSPFPGLGENTGTNRSSNISNWTWTCGTTQCLESKKPPVFIED